MTSDIPPLEMPLFIRRHPFQERPTMIQLGQQVRDKVSGFTGIATSRVEYLNGCVQYAIRPRVEADGKFPEAHYFDEEQLEVVGEGIAIRQRKAGGPPMDAPTSYRG